MSNTKDTPMDYKTAEEILEFQLSYSSTLFSDTMRSLYNGHAIRAIKQYADQQNASLKLELQKQKELNDELVKAAEEAMKHLRAFKEVSGLPTDDVESQNAYRNLKAAIKSARL